MLMDMHGADRGDTGFTEPTGHIFLAVDLSVARTNASFAPRGGRAKNLVNNVKSKWSEWEIRAQLAAYNSGREEPPWQGAVPDTDKLEASIQTDPRELWWRGSKCDLCIYEALILYQGVYYCKPHWTLFGGF